jgi:hypothetical protein
MEGGTNKEIRIGTLEKIIGRRKEGKDKESINLGENK